MKNRLKSIPAILLAVLILSTSALMGQGTIKVGWKPFQFFANDSSRLYLKSKLPQLISSGIQYNSSLTCVLLPQLSDLGNIRLSKSKSSKGVDSSSVARYKKLLDASNIKYLLEGALYVENQQFFIIVNGTNFKDKLIPYQSEKRPLSEMADVIDKACENINYQIRRIEFQSSKPAVIAVVNFGMNYSGSGTDLEQDDFYRQNFLALYLRNNLKNSKDFLVMPETVYNNFTSKDLDGTQRILVSGNIVVSANGNCSVQPVIHFSRSDSIVLQATTGSLTYKDKLLNNVLNNIQTTLNATVINGDATDIKHFIETNDHKQADYEAAFTKACDSNQYSLAYYYAEQLSIDRSCDTTRGIFLKGKLLYIEGNFSGATGFLSNYVKSHHDNPEANYMLGLCYSRIGKNRDAIKLFASIDAKASAAKDVYYQLGVCYYGLDSIRRSLENFKKQIAFNEGAHNDIYYLMAVCYQSLKDWEPGLQCIQKSYLQDTTSQVKKMYASEYYYDYATSRFDNKDYKNAYDYYLKSQQISKSEYSYFAVIRAAIYLDSPDELIMSKINDGLSAKALSENVIYTDVASVYDGIRDSKNAYIPANIKRSVRYCLLQVPFCSDSLTLAYTYRHLGSDYFRLHLMDSALYYYKRALQINVPVTNPEDTYANYLNLAELQLTLYDADGALNTLAVLDTKYNIKKEGALSADLRSYLLLYYFYNMESKIMKNTSYLDETAQVQKMIRPGTSSYTRSLSYWSFRTFYNWIVNNSQADDAKKKKLMDNLCPLLPLSADNDLVCVSKTR